MRETPGLCGFMADDRGGLSFDILSFDDTNESERMLEVKATRLNGIVCSSPSPQVRPTR